METAQGGRASVGAIRRGVRRGVRQLVVGHLKPVRTLRLQDEDFVNELTHVLGRYLGVS